MTALTDNKEVAEKNRRLLSQEVEGSAVIHKGALVKIKANGNLAPMSAEAGAHAAGIAYEACDNSAGASGDVECKVLREGVFELVSAGLAQSDMGEEVFASDDQTVSTVQGANELSVGRIVRVLSATAALVDISV